MENLMEDYLTSELVALPKITRFDQSYIYGRHDRALSAVLHTPGRPVPAAELHIGLPWGSAGFDAYRTILKRIGAKYNEGTVLWAVHMDGTWSEEFRNTFLTVLRNSDLIHSITPTSTYISLGSVIDDWIHNQTKWGLDIEDFHNIGLSIPYSDREVAKSLGANYYAQEKIWELGVSEAIKLSPDDIKLIDSHKWFLGFFSKRGMFTSNSDFMANAFSHYHPWRGLDVKYDTRKYGLENKVDKAMIAKKYNADDLVFFFEQCIPNKDSTLPQMIVMSWSATNQLTKAREHGQKQMTLADGAAAWRLAHDLGWTL